MTIPIYKNGTGYVAGVIKCGVDIEVTDLGDGVVLLGDLSETSQWASRSRSVSVSGSRSVSKSMSRSVSKSRSNSRSAAPFSQSRSASTAPFSRSRSASNAPFSRSKSSSRSQSASSAPLSQSRSASQVLSQSRSVSRAPASQSRSVSRAPASQSRSVSRVLSQSRSASNAPFSRSKSSSRSQSVSGSRSRSTSRSAIPTCYNSISDDFNRDDETPFSTSGVWSERFQGGARPNLVNNRCEYTGATEPVTGYVEYNHSSEMCSDDHYAQIDISGAYDTDTAFWFRIHVRDFGYFAQLYWASSGNTDRYIFDSSWSQLATNNGASGNVTWKLGVVGNSITVYRSGVAVLSTSNSGHPTGKIVGFGLAPEKLGTGEYLAADNFVAETIAGE